MRRNDQTFFPKWAEIVAQLAERSLLIPEACGSNLANVKNINRTCFSVEKTNVKKKESGNGHFNNLERRNLKIVCLHRQDILLSAPFRNLGPILKNYFCHN